MLSFGVTTVEGKSGYGLDRETEIKQLEVMKALDACPPYRHCPHVPWRPCRPEGIPRRSRQVRGLYHSRCTPGDRAYSASPSSATFSARRVCLTSHNRGAFWRPPARSAWRRSSTRTSSRHWAARSLQPNWARFPRTISSMHRKKGSHEWQHATLSLCCSRRPPSALKEPYAPARSMIDRGCAVALATDFNPGSCFSESIPLIFALATLYMGMTPEEAVTACTLNGAAALGRAGIIGSLDAGKQGDLVILEFPSYLFIPYHVGVNCVEKVVKRGKIVYDSETEARRGSSPCS